MKFLRKIIRFKFWLGLFTIVSILGLLLSYLSVIIHPEKFQWFSIFGLGYPIVFLANILFLIIWIFLKSKLSYAIILTLLVGWQYHFRTFCIGMEDSNKIASTELKVQSYNVHLFDAFNSIASERKQKKEQMLDYLKKSNSDVYCLQEYYNKNNRHFWKKLKEKIGVKFETKRFSKSFVNESFGVVILSKHKIINKGDVPFSRLDLTNNYCVYADIVKKQDTFRVYNVHLQSISLSTLRNEENLNDKIGATTRQILRAMPYRANQSIKVMKHIKTSPYPVIVCGDFNAPPMSYTYSIFYDELEDGFRNSCFGIGNTYAGKLPAGRIDYIFHSSTLGVKNFEIQEEKPSDHYGISCTLFKN